MGVNFKDSHAEDYKALYTRTHYQRFIQSILSCRRLQGTVYAYTLSALHTINTKNFFIEALSHGSYTGYMDYTEVEKVLSPNLVR
jgi:hypothetical protein